MTWTSEKLGRAGAAAVLAAVGSVVIVDGYHPCDGLAPLIVLPALCAAIAVVAALPRVTARSIVLPGVVALAVIAVAIGLDYSASGAVGPEGDQCDPVPGFAGFLLAAGISGFLAGAGLLAAMVVAALVEAVRRTTGSQPGHEAGIK